MKNANVIVKEFREKNRRRKVWIRVVAILSCAVVLCTEYNLTFPAITEEHQPYCGLEEHSHSIENGCYEKYLICGYEDETAVFTSQQIDTEDSEHIEETAPAVHEHTDDCYEWRLICDKEEHIHTASCFSDPDADVEKQEDWEKKLAELELTGTYRMDLQSVARSQIGYKESLKNYTVAIDLAGEEVCQGYTRYGAWKGDPYMDWNCAFVSFCLEYAGISETSFPRGSDCTDWITKLTEQNRYDNAQEYQSDEYGGPFEGDLAFFDSDKDGAADRVGIVSERIFADDGVTLTGMKAIEGDSDGAVKENTYSLSEDSNITGYGVLPDDGAYGAATADETDPISLYHQLTAENYKDLLTVGCPDIGGYGPIAIVQNGYYLYADHANGEKVTAKPLVDGKIPESDYDYAVCWYLVPITRDGKEGFAIAAECGHVADNNGTIAKYRTIYRANGYKNNFWFMWHADKSTVTRSDKSTNFNFRVTQDKGTLICDAGKPDDVLKLPPNGDNFMGGIDTVQTTPKTISTVSPSSTRIDLFDYRVDTTRNWQEDNYKLDGINIGHKLLFGDGVGGTTGNYGKDEPKNANRWVTNDHPFFQGMVKSMLEDGYPVLNESGSNLAFNGDDKKDMGGGESLDYLFELSTPNRTEII